MLDSESSPSPLDHFSRMRFSLGSTLRIVMRNSRAIYSFDVLSIRLTAISRNVSSRSNPKSRWYSSSIIASNSGTAGRFFGQVQTPTSQECEDEAVGTESQPTWLHVISLEQESRCLLNSVIAKAPSREALLTAIRDSKTFTEPACNLALQQAPAAWTARQHSRE